MYYLKQKATKEAEIIVEQKKIKEKKSKKNKKKKSLVIETDVGGDDRDRPLPLPPQLSQLTCVGTSIVTLSPATAVSRSSLSS